ncbi:MAG: hypothetical protein PHT55_04755, partial [Spirochaetales bacterium]|nr:hypothetical protein [Spirochaetales bacterium]
MAQIDALNAPATELGNEEAAARAARAALAAAARIVVKIGTATITKPKDAPARLTRSHKTSGAEAGRPGVDSAYIHQVAEQFSQLVAAGKQLI